MDEILTLMTNLPDAADVSTPRVGGIAASEVTAHIPEAIRPNDRFSRFTNWWDAATYLGLAFFAAITLLNVTDGARAGITLAATAGIAVTYRLIGAAAVAADNCTRGYKRALAYLVILFALTTLIAATAPWGMMLLFVAYTHCWMLCDTVSDRPLRDGIVLVITLAALTTVATWSRFDWEFDALMRLLPDVGITMLFSIGIGLWVVKTTIDAEQNANIVDQLRDAQEQLALQQHAAGVTAERERLAREIHDTLAQGFMSVVTLSQVADDALVDGDIAGARKRLAVMQTTARENLAEARSLVAAFAPVPLQDASLPDALRRLAERWADETGITITVGIDELPALPASFDVVLLRAAQEALSNVRRHADANAVSIALRYRRDDTPSITLVVADDGRGISSPGSEGYGLAGMRERVAAVGGTVNVQPAAGNRGTSVTITLPTKYSPAWRELRNNS
ncbi:MAG: sensor histidine kinase [Promicromonosporaceae bacterium]|nr:sensor histidine kinase [Promicromonosporaceae bacterium]